jgi:hypothetical protein
MRFFFHILKFIFFKFVGLNLVGQCTHVMCLKTYPALSMNIFETHPKLWNKHIFSNLYIFEYTFDYNIDFEKNKNTLHVPSRYIQINNITTQH